MIVVTLVTEVKDTISLIANIGTHIAVVQLNLILFVSLLSQRGQDDRCHIYNTHITPT